LRGPGVKPCGLPPPPPPPPPNPWVTTYLSELQKLGSEGSRFFLRGVVLGVWGLGFWVLRLCGVGWGNGWVGLMGGVNKEEGGLL